MTNRTDTTLPWPDGSLYVPDGDDRMRIVGMGYLTATVRRLIAERDERIARLTEALAALERTAGQPAAYDDPVRVNARAALENTDGR